MDVTKINVFKCNNDVIVGNGSVVFDGVFFVKFSILKSSKDGSLFVSWPSRKSTKDDKYYPDCGYVIDDQAESPYEFKNGVDAAIIKEYNKVVGISSTETTTNKKENTDKTEEKTDKPVSLVKFGPKK